MQFSETKNDVISDMIKYFTLKFFKEIIENFVTFAE